MSIQLHNPYESLTGGRWMRGNLHTHTTASDGRRPHQEVIDDYAARGYDFLMISDHDVYTGPEVYAGLDARGMILIPGNEITARGVHLLHVNADRLIAPHGLRQNVINAINRTQGFAIVNHPNWQSRFDHCTRAQAIEWVDYTGMEIFNGVVQRLDGSAYATDKWDMVLNDCRQVWGFANDDSHLAEHDVELGWNTAYVTDASPAGVVDALRSGRFYASTGVTITRIEVDGHRVRVETDNAQRLVAMRELGKRILTVDGSAIEVEAPDDCAYIRIECWGAGERQAWTQPFFNRAVLPA